MITTILLKDLKLFLSDKKSVIMTFLLPILLILLFAFAFGGIGSGKSEPKSINLLVSDLDNSTETAAIFKSFDSVRGIKLIKTDLNKATDLVRKGKYVGVLIFGRGFNDSIAQNKKIPLELKYDASKEIEMGMLQAVLMENLMQNIGKTMISKNINSMIDDKFPNLTSNMKSKIISQINESDSDTNTTDKMAIKMTSLMKKSNKNNANLGLIQAVAGTAIMMLLFSISGIGGGLLDEKEAGTFKRLLYSPLKPSTILFGKMGAALIIAISQLFVMFLFSWLAFGLPIFKDVPSLLLIIFTTAFAVSSFGIFLVSIAKTRQQLNSLSSIIILTMSAIGGSMIPLFVMPVIMQKIAVVSVNYWGIQGFYDIFWRSLSFTEILPRAFVLIGIGIVMTIISLYLFKRSLRNVLG
jgi:ABC-type multidrug transport system permease subunit